MLIKWLSGNVRGFFGCFFWGSSTPASAATRFCAWRRVASERQQTDFWLSVFFFSFFPPRTAEGVAAETQSQHNNGPLSLALSFSLSLARPLTRSLSAWEESGEAGGVYLSHGNWFAGVEVGSFKKTSFSVTPSHLSVWKAAGRESERESEGVPPLLMLRMHFSYKGLRKRASAS